MPKRPAKVVVITKLWLPDERVEDMRKQTAEKGKEQGAGYPRTL